MGLFKPHTLLGRFGRSKFGKGLKNVGLGALKVFAPRAAMLVGGADNVLKIISKAKEQKIIKSDKIAETMKANGVTPTASKLQDFVNGIKSTIASQNGLTLPNTSVSAAVDNTEKRTTLTVYTHRIKDVFIKSWSYLKANKWTWSVIPVIIFAIVWLVFKPFTLFKKGRNSAGSRFTRKK